MEYYKKYLKYKNKYISLKEQLGGDNPCINTLMTEPLLDDNIENIITYVSSSTATYPHDINGINITEAGGSTGSVIVELPSKTKYVIKFGSKGKVASPENTIKSQFHHTMAEFYANCFYNRASTFTNPIQTIKMKQFQFEIGGDNFFVIVNEYIDGKLFSEYFDTNTNVRDIAKLLTKGFIMDCILQNDDVTGLSDDNLMIKDDLTPVRIDTGASFYFTGSGKLKSSWNDNGVDKILYYSKLKEAPPGKYVPDNITKLRNIMNMGFLAVYNDRYKLQEPKLTECMLKDCLKNMYSIEQYGSLESRIKNALNENKSEFEDLFKNVVHSTSGSYENYEGFIMNRMKNIKDFIFSD